MTTIADQLFASVLIEAAKKAAQGEGDTAAVQAIEAGQALLYATERAARTDRCEECGGPLDDGHQPCDRCIFCGPGGPSEDEINETERRRR